MGYASSSDQVIVKGIVGSVLEEMTNSSGVAHILVSDI